MAACLPCHARPSWTAARCDLCSGPFLAPFKRGVCLPACLSVGSCSRFWSSLCASPACLVCTALIQNTVSVTAVPQDSRWNSQPPYQAKHVPQKEKNDLVWSDSRGTCQAHCNAAASRCLTWTSSFKACWQHCPMASSLQGSQLCMSRLRFQVLGSHTSAGVHPAGVADGGTSNSSAQ